MKGISDSALVALREAFEIHEVPKAASRTTFWRAVHDSYNKVATTIELDLTMGRPFTWHIARLDNMLRDLLADSNGFRFMMRAATQGGLVIELSGCLYCDEAEPGNPLDPDNPTKVWMFYVGFLEFEQWALQREESWLCIAAIRTNIANKIRGKIAGVARRIRYSESKRTWEYRCCLGTTKSSPHL